MAAAPPKVPSEAKAAFIALLVIAGTASIIDNGVIGWIVAPFCILLGWFAILRAPLRNTMLTLMFFGLVLENPSEGPASGQWATPFQPIGALMLAHFKATLGGWMFFGGMDLMLAAAVAAYFMHGRAARRGIPTPRPMIKLAQLTFATIVFTLVLGKLRGGDTSFAVWQIDRVIYLPTVFLLCQSAFSTPGDYFAVGKVALSAALLRATQAMYVRMTVSHTVDAVTNESSLPYATTHNDSMLFATGSVILVSLILQRAGKKYNRLAMWAIPVLIGGMIANNRRMVWVEIILVFFTLYMMTDTNAFKRKMNRILLLSAPVLVGYIAAGWGSSSGIFKPVKVIRSAVDSSADTSTAWRDLENFNLVFTMRNFPITGVGYGNGFWEMWPMPAVDYTLERYVPHDSILGLFCYGGVIGYFGITTLWVAGIYFAIRSYHHCKDPFQKAAALTSFGAVLVYYLQCFGDMGLGSWTGVYLVAPAMAIASKLAVTSGAWEEKVPARTARSGFASGAASQKV